MMRAPLIIMLALVHAPASAAATPTADYVRIEQSVVIDRSSDAVWARIGGYCAIAEWMLVRCQYASGSGEVGTVRALRDAAVVEVMVAKTDHSYTYWQTTGNMAATGYHGTLAVEATATHRSRLIYTLFYDQSALASDELRKSEHQRLAGRFLSLLVTMKGLVMRP